jgi:hypothetical protein
MSKEKQMNFLLTLPKTYPKMEDQPTEFYIQIDDNVCKRWSGKTGYVTVLQGGDGEYYIPYGKHVHNTEEEARKKDGNGGMFSPRIGIFSILFPKDVE